MISNKEFIVIHELKKQGYSIRSIAKILKLHRNTVTNHLHSPTLQAASRICNKPSKLDPFKSYIVDLIGKTNYRLPCSAILELIKEQGYTGGRSILQEYLAKEYQTLVSNHDPVVRFETEPGEQAQADWTTIRSGRNPIYAFVMTLGYSRASFVYFTTRCEDEDLVLCVEKALAYFNGVPKTILYDNMKAVVIERNAYGGGEHRFNDAMLDCAKFYGFEIKLCRPYRAKTKGKVERFNGYLKGNFYRPLVARLAGSSIEITTELLNAHISSWLLKANARIHGTTNKVPSDELNNIERTALLPYVGRLHHKPAMYITRRIKELPVTTVQRPDLGEYDLLLEVVA